MKKPVAGSAVEYMLVKREGISSLFLLTAASEEHEWFSFLHNMKTRLLHISLQMVLTGKSFKYLNQALLGNKLYKIPSIDILGYCYLNLGGVIVTYTALE